ncbi:Metallo-dependent phosphatase-like protein [Aspergillus pseudoustus]|uniref:Metallo-dependent phosphatase-like protein n=1 Tax=Aspergillus pseudoustus TaxID=1810923 RepID=A0ABR4KCY6_9EURO
MTTTNAPDNVFPVTAFTSDLPSSLIPQPQPQSQSQPQSTNPEDDSKQPPARRLIIIGDVHGMRHSLETLLAKLAFNKDAGDHLILTGDLVNKGPDSPGVLDLAMRLGASAVRGNHDNAVLNAHAEIASAGGWSEFQIPEKYTDSPVNKYTTTMALSSDHMKWLASLPLAIRMKIPPEGVVVGSGSERAFGGSETLIVVHAGLVPGVELEEQDPHAVMHLRSLVPVPGNGDSSDNNSSSNSERKDQFSPAEEHGDESWVATWDRYQETVAASKTSVVFGHDAKRKLQLGKYATGLDSGCLYSGRLSALVIEVSEDGNSLQKSIVQVECADEPVAPKEKGKEGK